MKDSLSRLRQEARERRSQGFAKRQESSLTALVPLAGSLALAAAERKPGQQPAPQGSNDPSLLQKHVTIPPKRPHVATFGAILERCGRVVGPENVIWDSTCVHRDAHNRQPLLRFCLHRAFRLGSRLVLLLGRARELVNVTDTSFCETTQSGLPTGRRHARRHRVQGASSRSVASAELCRTGPNPPLYEAKSAPLVRSGPQKVQQNGAFLGLVAGAFCLT